MDFCISRIACNVDFVIILLGHKLLESLFSLVGVANIYGGNEANSKED